MISVECKKVNFTVGFKQDVEHRIDTIFGTHKVDFGMMIKKKIEIKSDYVIFSKSIQKKGIICYQNFGKNVEPPAFIKPSPTA